MDNGLLQAKTGAWDYNSHGLANLGLENCCLVWWVSISAVTLKWQGKNLALTNKTLPDHQQAWHVQSHFNLLSSLFRWLHYGWYGKTNGTSLQTTVKAKFSPQRIFFLCLILKVPFIFKTFPLFLPSCFFPSWLTSPRCQNIFPCSWYFIKQWELFCFANTHLLKHLPGSHTGDKCEFASKSPGEMTREELYSSISFY